MTTTVGPYERDSSYQSAARQAPEPPRSACRPSWPCARTSHAPRWRMPAAADDQVIPHGAGQVIPHPGPCVDGV